MEGILIFILYLALAALFLMLVTGAIGFIPMLISDFSLVTLIGLGTMYLYFVNYFIVVRYLLKLIKSCETTPFIQENVKRFKTMGYCLLINSVFEVFMGYKGNLGGNIQILATSEGAITPPMLICFLASLMCFVMAKIFNTAIRIKNENDLTI